MSSCQCYSALHYEASKSCLYVLYLDRLFTVFVSPVLINCFLCTVLFCSDYTPCDTFQTAMHNCIKLPEWDNNVGTLQSCPHFRIPLPAPLHLLLLPLSPTRSQNTVTKKVDYTSSCSMLNNGIDHSTIIRKIAPSNEITQITHKFSIINAIAS